MGTTNVIQSEIELLKNFKIIADVETKKSVSVNVKKLYNTDNCKTAKKDVLLGANFTEKSASQKIKVLNSVLMQSDGKKPTALGEKFFNAFNLKSTDISVPYLNASFSQLTCKGINIAIEICKVTEKQKLFELKIGKFEELQYSLNDYSIILSSLDSKFRVNLKSGKVEIFDKKDMSTRYTIKLVNYSFSNILTKISNLRKFEISEKMQTIIDENKVEEVKKIDFSKFTLDELIAMKKAEMQIETVNETSEILKSAM